MVQKISQCLTAMAFATTCLLLAGCVEQSTVVKVKSDGSGLVHIRVHQQNTAFFSFTDDSKNEKNIKLPSEEDLAKLVKQMGNAVDLVSSLEKTNRHGWPGYELILKFKDVNQLTIPGELLTKPMAKSAKAAKGDQKEKKGQKKGLGGLQGNTTFALHDGLLKIHMSGMDGVAEEDEAVVQGAVDPFAAEPASPLAKMSLPDLAIQEFASQLLADARVGFFVEIEGQVIESNAKFRKDNLVTLAQANFGEILKDAKGLADLKSLENNASKLSRKMLSTISEKIPGLDIDLQNPIEIRFK